MATCYLCGSPGANYRREVYTGRSKWTNYGRRITFSRGTHYGVKSLCKECAKREDWWSDAKVVFWQLVALGFLIHIYLH